MWHAMYDVASWDAPDWTQAARRTAKRTDAGVTCQL
jgi:hypothetical protein